MRAVKDVMKIKELMRELNEAKRPLPYLRMNELRYLDVMTSPYSQLLIEMLQSED